jgi:hypothetical protein
MTWIKTVLIPWVKHKIDAERPLIIATVASLTFILRDALTGDVAWNSAYEVAVALVAGVIVRVFVTSEGVKPGWRSTSE